MADEKKRNKKKQQTPDIDAALAESIFSQIDPKELEAIYASIPQSRVQPPSMLSQIASLGLNRLAFEFNKDNLQAQADARNMGKRNQVTQALVPHLIDLKELKVNTLMQQAEQLQKMQEAQNKMREEKLKDMLLFKAKVDSELGRTTTMDEFGELYDRREARMQGLALRQYEELAKQLEASGKTRYTATPEGQNALSEVERARVNKEHFNQANFEFKNGVLGNIFDGPSPVVGTTYNPYTTDPTSTRPIETGLKITPGGPKVESLADLIGGTDVKDGGIPVIRGNKLFPKLFPQQQEKPNTKQGQNFESSSPRRDIGSSYYPVQIYGAPDASIKGRSRNNSTTPKPANPDAKSRKGESGGKKTSHTKPSANTKPAFEMPNFDSDSGSSSKKGSSYFPATIYGAPDTSILEQLLNMTNQ